MKTWLPFALLAAGCIHGAHVPSDLQGDIAVRIANQASGDICALMIQPFTETQGRVDNWLGDSFRTHKIKAGAEYEVHIKAGAYRLGVAACDSSWAAGTQHQKLEIDRATYVAIGGKGQAPADYRLVSLTPVAPQVAQQSGGGGEEAPAEEPAAAEPAASSSSAASAESAPTEAAKPAGPSCQPLGASVRSGSECCSNKTAWHNDGVGYLCCQSGSNCS